MTSYCYTLPHQPSLGLFPSDLIRVTYLGAQESFDFGRSNLHNFKSALERLPKVKAAFHGLYNTVASTAGVIQTRT